MPSVPATLFGLLPDVSLKGWLACCPSGMATIWLLGGMSFLLNQPPLDEEPYAGLDLFLKENLPDFWLPLASSFTPTLYPRRLLPRLPRDHSLEAKTMNGIEKRSKKTVVHAVAMALVPKLAVKPAFLKWFLPFA